MLPCFMVLVYSKMNFDSMDNMADIYITLTLMAMQT